LDAYDCRNPVRGARASARSILRMHNPSTRRTDKVVATARIGAHSRIPRRPEPLLTAAVRAIAQQNRLGLRGGASLEREARLPRARGFCSLRTTWTRSRPGRPRRGSLDNLETRF